MRLGYRFTPRVVSGNLCHFVVNANEISAIRYIAPDALDAEIVSKPEQFTPWFKIEWARIRAQHAGVYARQPAASLA